MKIFSAPNILSLSRIVLLPFLYFLLFADLKVIMLISYIIIGSTDYFDGKIARRLNQTTDLGKTLDSVADLFFYLSSAFFIYYLFPDVIDANFTLLMILFGVKILSFVISVVKCNKPLLMHTTLLRLSAAMVYFLFIFSFFFDTSYFATIVIMLYMIAFLEEISIFIIYGKIDPDTRSIFTLP
ncbi:MAG: CDP-alcohol phosphatidyltransferase family protein [Deltaproteobacteria bacterium]|nr:CDP-alcohol phosphatidyltransferase family protein [Deltaproteobacteria bacterium]